MDDTNYEAKKAQLIQAIKSSSSRDTLSLQKTTSNLFRNRQTTSKKVDVRHFDQVLEVNGEAGYVEAEGMATYETIVNATLKQGYLPAVVPELKTITLGGALSGVGIESSSFRYGLVHETVLEFEVLLGDGHIITCRPNNEHADLFYAFPNSYGTLGYALKVKVKVIPCKPYVKLTHIRSNDAATHFGKLEELCDANRKQGQYAYIDATAFSPNEMYITLGEFVDSAPKLSNYRYMNIYYRSLQQKNIDYLSTYDYIWRWDADWFWCSRFFGMQRLLPRLLLGKWMLHSRCYWKIMRFVRNNKIAQWIEKHLAKPTESVIQDVEIPIENCVQFFDFFFKNIPVQPLWMCPIYAYDDQAHFNFFDLPKNKLLINFGFWQAVPQKHHDGYYNQKIEQQVEALSGHKSLYSNVYYDEEKFWTIYDKALYDRLKQKYDSKYSLKNLYDKVTEK